MIEGLNPSLLNRSHVVTVSTFFTCQICVNKLEVGSLRVLPSPSMLQQRITEIDQQKEELKIEVSMSRDLDKNLISLSIYFIYLF